MQFKPYACDFNITIGGVTYDFLHVDSFEVEDNERTRLVRGANAKNKLGLVYKEGIKEPKIITVTLANVDETLYPILETAFKNATRLDVSCIDRATGSSKGGKNCVLSSQPQQLLVDESAESMNIALIFETFDIYEVHKAEA